MRQDVGRLVGHLAVAPDAVARQVGADIEIEPERGDAGIADIGHADDRARFRIELAEAVKRGRELFRQDRQIALDEAVGDTSRGGRHAGAAGETGRVAGNLFGAARSLCRQNSHVPVLPNISTSTLNPNRAIKSNRRF